MAVKLQTNFASVDELQNYWGVKSNELSAQEKAHFNQRLGLLVEKTRSVIASITFSGNTEQAKKDIAHAISKLNNAALKLFESNESYKQRVLERDRGLNSLSSRIRDTSLEFGSFNPMDPFMPTNPKDQIEYGMRAVNALSLPLRAVGAGIEAACNSTETTQQVCRAVGAGIGLVVDQVKKVPGVVTLHNKIKEREEEVKKGFERDFGIKPETTDYFFESAHMLAGAGALGLAGKGATALRRIAKSREVADSVTKFCKDADFLITLKPNKTAVATLNQVTNEGYAVGGHTWQTVDRIKDIAISGGAKKLVLEAQFVNDRLAESFAKRFKPLKKFTKEVDRGLEVEFSRFEIPLEGHVLRHPPEKHKLSVSNPVEVCERRQYNFYLLTSSDGVRIAIADVSVLYNFSNNGSSLRLMRELRENAHNLKAKRLIVEVDVGPFSDLDAFHSETQRYLKILNKRYKSLGVKSDVHSFEIPMDVKKS